jgi:PAS domain S-box-containing protein
MNKMNFANYNNSEYYLLISLMDQANIRLPLSLSEIDKTFAAQKQAILAAIVDTSDDAILSKTLDGNITSWNRSAEKMFGYSEAEALGQHITLIIPADRLEEEHFIISSIKSGNKVDHFQTFRQAKNGNLIPISLTVSPIIDGNGKIVGASKIARDVSAQQAALAENARLFAEIQSLNEKKDEFIGLASHELKTPLTSINGYLQIVSSMVTDERATQFLQKARQQVKKLNTLVSDLLDVSKIEAGKLQIAAEAFDIGQVLDDAIELIGYENKSHTIERTVAGHVTVTGDAHRIEQVIINLLTNAIRYSPGADKIEAGLTREANEVLVWVKDYGLGIPADKQPHIFTRFYRVNDDNPTVSGLGIGLYLSKEIILRHSGRIWVESEPGKGSTFFFSLPMPAAQ